MCNRYWTGLLPFLNEISDIGRHQIQTIWTEDTVINQEIMESLEILEGLSIDKLIEKKTEFLGEDR